MLLVPVIAIGIVVASIVSSFFFGVYTGVVAVRHHSIVAGFKSIRYGVVASQTRVRMHTCASRACAYAYV